MPGTPREGSVAAIQAHYRAGGDDHLRHLDAQRNDSTNQTTLIQARTQRQIALATLFRSLGGDWHGEPSAQVGNGADMAAAGSTTW